MRAFAALFLVACAEAQPIVNAPSIDECDRNRYVSDPESNEFVRINVRDLTTSDHLLQSVCVQIDGRTARLMVRAHDADQILLDEMIHVRPGSQHVLTVFASTSKTKGPPEARMPLTARRVIIVGESADHNHDIDALVEDDSVKLRRSE